MKAFGDRGLRNETKSANEDSVSYQSCGKTKASTKGFFWVELDRESEKEENYKEA